MTQAYDKAIKHDILTTRLMWTNDKIEEICDSPPIFKSNSIYLFGGLDNNQQPCNDLYCIRPDALKN